MSTTAPRRSVTGAAPGWAPAGLPFPREGGSGLLGLPGVPPEPPSSPRLVRLVVWSVVAGLLLALAALPVVGGLGLTAKAGTDSFNELPSELVVPPLPERSLILDRDGKPIAELHGSEDRVNVPLARIPVSLRQAIVAIEDRRFYEHHGVDYRGVARAVVTNQENGAITQGGSTLTQQYVKNVLLTLADDDEGKNAATERSVRRKLREARYALALEKRLTKDQILANYLNIAYFGDGAYGAAAAAQHYFGIDISTLNPVQSATLAGLVQNPNGYNPKLHPALAQQRRNQVLAAMRDAGYITQPAYGFSITLPVTVRHSAPPSDNCEVAGSSAFFCQYVRQTLLDDPAFGPTPEQRQRKLFEGGLRIRTSLDPAAQAAAQASVDRTVPSGNRVAAAVVVMQPGTGEVKAMAVNRVFAPTADGKPVETTTDRVHTKLNYALLPFQPGSTAKAFTLAAALEQGLPLSTTFNSPTCYRSTLFGNPASGCFKNAGDSESGRFDMSQATWHSVNTYYIQLEEQVGVLKARDMAKRLGVTSPRLDEVGPADGSFTLGTFEVTPLDMATAYATLAAHGKQCSAKPLLSVSEHGKASSYAGPGRCQQAIDPAVADTVSSVLTGVIREGTAKANGSIGRPAAGKTGTTEDNQSAWFVGYVPQLVSATWVGDYRSPTTFPLRRSPTTPEGVPVPGWGGGTVFGGDLPTKLWAATMRAATTNLPVEPFRPPDRIVVRGLQVGVPSVAGLPVPNAFEMLRAAGFVPISGGSTTSSVPGGLVAYTSPGGGADVTPGTRVSVFVSRGPAAGSAVGPEAPAVDAVVPSPSVSSEPPADLPVAPSPEPSSNPDPAAPTTAPSPRPTSTSTATAPAPKPTRTKPGPSKPKPTKPKARGGRG
ncbi:MAG: hypothetical protein QOJ32_1103 [Frankiaceae bacterium]|nr:hypothetical protein [Frankiaceae bacterium]